jgi:regulator of sigma E protease
MASDGLIVLSFFIGIIVVVVLVTLHELGHFIIAKMSNAYVYEFSIGFGPRLFTIKGKETWFSVRMIPLGGFCSIASEIADPPKGREDVDVPAERMMEYIARWKKAIFIIMGPLFNLFIAIFLFTTIFAATQAKTNDMDWFGAKYTDISERLITDTIGTESSERYVIMGWEVTTTDQTNALDDKTIIFNNVADKKDDLVNGEKIYDNVRDAKNAATFTKTVYTFIDNLSQNPANLATDHVFVRFAIRPTVSIYDDTLVPLAKDANIWTAFSQPDEYQFGANVGIAAPTRHFATAGAAYAFGWKETFVTSGNILKSLGMLVTGHIDQFSGPVGMSRQVAAMISSPDSFFLYVAMISANLFIVNILTIPPLDGYKFIENIIEMIIRKPISNKVKIWLYTIGAALFAVIFIVIVIKDFI